MWQKTSSTRFRFFSSLSNAPFANGWIMPMFAYKQQLQACTASLQPTCAGLHCYIAMFNNRSTCWLVKVDWTTTVQVGTCSTMWVSLRSLTSLMPIPSTFDPNGVLCTNERGNSRERSLGGHRYPSCRYHRPSTPMERYVPTREVTLERGLSVVIDIHHANTIGFRPHGARCISEGGDFRGKSLRGHRYPPC